MTRRGRLAAPGPAPSVPRRPWAVACALATAAAALQAQPTAPPAAAPYQDRVLQDLPPAEPDDGDPGPGYDSRGWPRYLRLEARLGTEPFDDQRRARAGLAAQALIETPNHGSLSLDGSLLPRQHGQPGGGTLTLRQQGMPLAGGWLANHELGVLDRPAPAVTRLPSRVFVPSSLLRGGALVWEQPDRGLQLLAAQGQPGQLLGLPSSRFLALPGTRRMLGLQAGQAAPGAGPAARGWTAAVQHEQADGVSPLADALPAQRADAASTHLVLRLDEDGHRVQAQAVHAESDAVAGARQGAWAEIEWDDGPRRHALGAYRLDPELQWAGQPLPADLQGAYYRGSWRSRQWSAEGQLDALTSVSGRQASGLFATASARWRLSRDHQLGAGLAVRHFDGDAWSTYADWRWQHALGATGTRLELAGGADQAGSHRILLDQDWAMPVGTSLSSSVGLGHEQPHASNGQQGGTLWTAALAGTAPLGPQVTLRATLGAEQGSQGQRSRNANLGGQWRLAPGWMLEGQYTRHLGRSAPGVSLDPLAPRPQDDITSSDRAFQLVLRMELSAGSRSAPLGGRAQQGGGRIQGVVYFDANRSGTREASEGGVANVVVTLDDRFATRTDAEGRFEFPFVAAGARRLAVRNDSLPLPWSAADEAPVAVDVSLRGTTELNLAVQRAP